MRGTLSDTLFREPEGVGSGALWLVLAAGVFGYAAFLASRGGSGQAFLVMLGGALSCFGLAESLPTRYRWPAGVLRVLGVIGGIGAIFVAL
ncbi:hypothetical protein [Halorubrum vacuolatum]|uniref:Uncharacterized protein n=1 Tax=Halorubrum vacuolatum TaxID=63740 RepID=A0A238UT79_HALVU|nr:hypothetical protein [Halorubrum vacuolatum]SNR24897.1 hypothetical protein SAMN06264855_101310 [Halorubrum vacuolatum]